jgi:rhodanese-related sulfurtransferase
MNHTKNNRQLLLILLVVVMALAGCSGQAAPAAPVEVPEVANLPVDLEIETVNNLRQQDGVYLLDVREDFEYAEGHIPNTTLVPLTTIPDNLDKIPRDKTVIVVCRSGNRSNQATQFLREQGFDNVHNMLGGMNAWQQAGYEVVK